MGKSHGQTFQSERRITTQDAPKEVRVRVDHHQWRKLRPLEEWLFRGWVLLTL